MRLIFVALMLLIGGATHAAAQQYQLFPASVAATNLQVQHHAVLVNTATGDREMIQFLAQMPTDTKIFLTMAVLGLAATLLVLKR